MPIPRVAGPYVSVLPVLGVEVAFESGSRHALELIEREYGHWKVLSEEPGLVSPSSARMRVDLREAVGGPTTQLSFEYAAPTATTMVAACEHGRGQADTSTLQARVEVDEELLEAPDAFTRGLLEPLVLFLIGTQDRVPLHAAGILRGEVGLVLAGPSGSGKSTLAYAATTCGYLPIADDPVYVQSRPPRVWGRRRHIHLRVESTRFFRELQGSRPQEIPGGKTKVVVDPGGNQRHADRVGLCILRRGGGKPRLTPISGERARQELTTRLDAGFDLFRDQVGESVMQVARLGAWFLEVGDSPFDALELLDEAAAAVASRR